MSNSRRYEILLPLKFNDGEPVPWTWETQIIHGIWQHQEAEFRDELVRVFADVPDRPENRQFFADFKEQLKSRFRQHDIWMTTYPIEVI